MTERHLFSDPLFELLFQHNLVSSDGYVIANEQELQEFSAFLARQKREETSDIYKTRKENVDEVLRIVRSGDIGPDEVEKMKDLLLKLNIEIDDEGQFLKLDIPVIEKDLGSSEPNQSYWEFKYADEIERKRVLRKDLKVLDKWLEEISLPWVKADKTPYVHSVKDELRYRARTNRRMDRMATDRRRLIEKLYKPEKKKSEEQGEEPTIESIQNKRHWKRCP